MLKRTRPFCVLAATLLLLACLISVASGRNNPGLSLTTQEQERIVRFERELEQLRTLLKIPGMSAAIVRDRQLIWARGFGYSDYENKASATPETPYPIASLTKTFAATLLMQLVEHGKISLDDPMSKYSNQYKDGAIRVRHILTHTSEGPVPGESYAYNGDLFGNLFDVIVKGSGKRFRLLLVQNILEKLGTTGTSPGNDLDANPSEMAALLGAENVKNYLGALKRLANSYKLYGADEIVRTYDPRRGLSPANGIISTVTDLAKYDAALDRNLFVKKETQELMWTPAVSTKGQTLPYGLGWFVQQHRGLKLVWHNGYLPDLYSALILKIPEKHVTLILLANSDALSAPFRLARGDIAASAFAASFLRLFVFEDKYQGELTAPAWGERDFYSRVAVLEKKAKGYRYDSETTANEAIREWLETRRSEAHKVINLDPKIYDAYVGQYQVGTDSPFTIVKENGRLMRHGRVQVELFPASQTEFFAKAVDLFYTFVKNEEGRVTRIKIRSGENEIIANKIK